VVQIAEEEFAGQSHPPEVRSAEDERVFHAQTALPYTHATNSSPGFHP
jgi:hypothetical protein